MITEAKLLIISVCTLSLTGCIDDPVNPERFYTTQVRTVDASLAPVPGAITEFYSNESNFWLRTNDRSKDTTNSDGSVFHTSKDTTQLWVYVHKGDLNNLRYGLRKEFAAGSFETAHPHRIGDTKEIYFKLTRTPTRLQISVLKNTKPVELAEVQLYFSEEARLSDVKAQDDTNELMESYASGSERDFKKTTDEAGVVLFDNLEPKQYWFKVTKDGLINDEGTIKIDEPLPDNINITTSITVGIN